MYTLGIWGFSADRPKHTYHDTGAAIVKDGHLVAAINEERMSRVQIVNEFPNACIDEVLKISGINFKDIDQVAFAGQPADVELRGKAHTCWKEFLRPSSQFMTRVSMFGRTYNLDQGRGS